jgi:NAD(P)-dependent dehydrogenase (short-subunit alcohol dehydrogenase family)
VKEDILKETPSAKVDLLKIDLASLESVRAAANEFLAINIPLNVLVCNAGRASSTLEFTVDGIEVDFATNYLGHFLLTQMLLDKLKVTAIKSGIESRIVNVSSEAHERFQMTGGIDFDAICKSEKTQGVGQNPGFFNVMKLYGQSKLAQVLYTRELAKRLHNDGVDNVTVNSLDPGTVATNITSSIGGIVKVFVSMMHKLVGEHVSQGAYLQTYLAVSPEVKAVTGKYFTNGKEYQVKGYAVDEDLQKRLWDFSMKLTSA